MLSQPLPSTPDAHSHGSRGNQIVGFEIYRRAARRYRVSVDPIYPNVYRASTLVSLVESHFHLNDVLGLVKLELEFASVDFRYVGLARPTRDIRDVIVEDVARHAPTGGATGAFVPSIPPVCGSGDFSYLEQSCCKKDVPESRGKSYLQHIGSPLIVSIQGFSFNLLEEYSVGEITITSRNVCARTRCSKPNVSTHFPGRR